MDNAQAPVPKKSGWSATNLLILALAIGLPSSLGLGVVIGTKALKPPPPAPAPAAPSAVTKLLIPAPSASAAAPKTVPELAANGDYKALDELKAKAATERTAEETLAIARGRSGNKARALDGFGKEIQKNIDLLKDKDQLQRLKDFFADRETTTQAAGLLVSLPGELGPDMLYDAATRPKGNPDTVQLADDLLVTKEVRAKASPALLATLDLRAATECEQFKDLLPMVAEKADRRSIPMLAKLASKKGCGDNKLKDCFECLRPLDKDKDKTVVTLGKAIGAAGKRAAPKF